MVRIRRAMLEDWARLYAWRNDFETRAYFRESGVIALKDHLAWLKKTLASRDVVLLLADDSEAGCTIGTIRFDRMTRKAESWVECSLTIEPRMRGRGYAAQVIASAMSWAWATFCDEDGKLVHISGIIANVKVDNYASLRAFASLDFTPMRFTDDMVTLERAR